MIGKKDNKKKWNILVECLIQNKSVQILLSFLIFILGHPKFYSTPWNKEKK